MKNRCPILALMVSLALLCPKTAFSQEQKKDEKKDGGAQQHGGRPAQQAAPRAAAPQQSHAANVQHQGGRAAASNQQVQVSHAANVQAATSQRSYSGGNAVYGQQRQAQAASYQAATAQLANGAAVSPQVAHARYARGGGNTGQATPNTQYQGSTGAAAAQQIAQGRNGRGGGYAGQTTPNAQYNSGNSYGGNWYPSETHSDWNQNGQYYWNNHNYRWYQGGWLIIDAGYNPYYVNNTGYASSNGSMVSSVQASLADLGYYNGPIDGRMGRGTHSAIANYQSDNNLPVTGVIDDTLLQSLQPQ